MQDKGPGGRLELFNDWFYNKENIDLCVVIHKRRMELKQKLKKVFVFMTRADLMKKYADEKMVDDVVKDKVKKGLWRPNPENPNNVKFTEYWCLKEESMTDSKSVSDEIGMESSTKMDAKMAMQFMNPVCEQPMPDGLSGAGYDNLLSAVGSGGSKGSFGCLLFSHMTLVSYYECNVSWA